MTIEEVQKESFYQQLSDGQQKYVVARCGGKDRIEAAKSAWACTTKDSAKAMASKTDRNANVAWLLNRFLGVGAARRVPTKEELAAWNWEKAQRVEDPGLSIKFAQNVARIMGYEQRPAETTPPPTPRPNDGDEPFDL